ncbi:glycosyltransferase family 2 protein [Mangrovicoccus algicola]|uniref:Glycosyltransferase family 2 protein n=1 Tax=Mangrovicoccus algicola TaxID=2771008 RepID=A0A8J7D0I8_9RHOB|nr:glycosyltransferase [Mangrovicoccus algicola]MBE3639508.1 glycosyltransferase family 2 protein [Mangrovicoccus algicola]
MPDPLSEALPELAVVIPHYNDLARLEKCLGALAPQAAAAGARVETVVADNDSPADLEPLRAAHPWARFVTEPQKGAAAARNRGVAETTAPFLAFLDSDCVPGPDWLATALRLSGGAAVTGGRIDTFDETPPPRSGAEAFETVFAFWQRSYVEQKGFSVTANLLTSRAVFEETGPMVVGLSEDMDWCFRARAKGHALVYRDELAVSHPTRQDWPALAKKWRRTTLEGFHLNGTSASGRAKWALRAVAVAASGPLHLPKVLGAERLSGQEKLRGAGTLLRLRAARAGWMLGQALRGA